MKEFFSMIKRWDIIIVIALVLLSFLPVVIFSYQQAQFTGDEYINVAVISVNNEEIKRIPLTNNEDTEIIEIYSSPSQYNIVEVRGESIRVIEANCRDQIDVHQGFVSQPGETIICLPHRFIIEIQTVNGTSEQDIIISS